MSITIKMALVSREEKRCDYFSLSPFVFVIENKEYILSNAT